MYKVGEGKNSAQRNKFYMRVLKEYLNLRNEINKYTCVYVDFIS
jgi:hypothetical protein